MTKFYQYDTRGASAADQIINLERMLEERDTEIDRLTDENNKIRELYNNLVYGIQDLVPYFKRQAE